ncbi:THO2 plays a role in transcriptional elongation, variant 2, partial [Basidiobolus ranarum]
METEEPEFKVERQRLVEVTKAVLNKDFISTVMMKERLEMQFLETIGLIASFRMFNKKAIRINTSLLYKQQKFNLLREESEGYAKLITELTSNTDSSFDNQEEPAIQARVNEVLQNVMTLIGYFDLDPNRVLDVILEVFITNVAKHYRFFLALLKNSSWAPRASQPIIKSDVDDIPVDSMLGSGEVGSKVCGQILGFKYSYYSNPDVEEETPEELYAVTALLIKEGFVDLSDIYPHLSPNDKEVEEEYKKFKDKMDDQAFSTGSNALTMMAALVDEDVGDGSSNATYGANDAEIPEPTALPRPLPNHKAGLTAALLAIGDLQHASFFLYKFPNMSATQPDVADNLCRIMHVMIEDVYRMYSPNRRLTHPIALKFRPKYRHSSSGNDRPVNPIKIPLISTKLPANTRHTTYEFYYPQWSANILRCVRLDEVHKTLNSLLKFTGVRISRDLILVGKLCRLGKAVMKELSANSKLKKTWIDMIRVYFLPTISLINANPGMVNEVWSVLKHLPYPVRYGLYGEWKVDSYKNFPELKVAKSKTVKDTKSIMRRISKENVKQYGRMLAKVSHSNPTIVFTTVLDQIQAYDNLVVPVVDACKYLTPFGYDVLTYIMLESLSNPMKPRLKNDGTSIAHWLQGLAAFCGTVFRKYSLMDLTGILQYVANQLKNDNSFDLIVLKELIIKMAGIEGYGSASDAQLAAMAGGETLKSEAFSVLNNVKSTKKSSSRLTRGLVESNLATPLAVLISQQRETCVYGSNSIDHLKLLGNLFDECQEVLMQYIELLATNLDKITYSKLIPSMIELCLTCKVEPDVAFHIIRPKLSYQLSLQETIPVPLAPLHDTSSIVNQDTSAAMQIDSTVPNSEVNADEAKSSEPVVERDFIGPQDRSTGVWQKGLSNIISDVTEILPVAAWKGISPQFYVTFWQLSLYDIHIPKDRYKAEIAKQRQIIHALDNDRNDLSSTSMNRKKKEKEKAQFIIDKLDRELGAQIANYEKTMARLRVEKDFWFIGCSNRYDIITQLIQYCVHPRCLFSANDAMFAAKFIKLMHSIGTANFSSLTLYDRILSDIACAIFSCTEKEANFYGIFLRETLSIISAWHGEKTLYDKEGRGDGLPGFQKKWGLGPRQYLAGKVPNEDLLDYEDYRHVVYKWHIKLHRAFVTCLESHEYMQTRNAILVLTKIDEFFPVIRKIGLSVEKSVGKIVETEKKEDLKILTIGYQAKLSKRKPNWLSNEQFHYVPPRENTGGNSTESSEVKASGTGEEKKESQNAKSYEGTPQDKTASSESTDRKSSRADRTSGDSARSSGNNKDNDSKKRDKNSGTANSTSNERQNPRSHNETRRTNTLTSRNNRNEPDNKAKDNREVRENDKEARKGNNDNASRGQFLGPSGVSRDNKNRDSREASRNSRDRERERVRASRDPTPEVSSRAQSEARSVVSSEDNRSKNIRDRLGARGDSDRRDRGNRDRRKEVLKDTKEEQANEREDSTNKRRKVEPENNANTTKPLTDDRKRE